MAERNAQEECLQRAVKAATKRDAAAYFKELAASAVLDGVTNALRRRWPKAGDDIIYHATAAAADNLYEHVVDGGPVRSPGGFLWGAAKNEMLEWYHRAQREVPLPELPEEQVESDETTRPDEGRLRAEALRLARQYLPKLGEINTQRIMAFIFDGIESGSVDLSNATVAEALELSAQTVRRCKSRGFQRLRREAEKTG